ncbi:MAG: hypothetical protein RML72_11850 [Bacteroidia bacterium]|nr:hypothetical protein [Bacteroidia bacterium]MDW8159551.1 hypothetical protein [Bacteroidia bacterium]
MKIITEKYQYPYLSPLPAEIRKQLESLEELFFENPQEAIAQLQELVEEFIEFPQIANTLLELLPKIGKVAEYDALACQLYDLFPECLFSQIHYALYCIQHEKHNLIPEIFDNLLTLEQLLKYYNANIHIQDLRGYLFAMGQYYLLVEDYEKSQNCLTLLKKYVPQSEEASLLEYLLSGEKSIH